MLGELVIQPNHNNREHSRREVMRAAQERDFEALQAFLEAYVRRYGTKGEATSPETFKLYRSGLGDFLSWCWPEGQNSPDVSILHATEDDLRRYVQHLTRRGLVASSVTAYLTTLRVQNGPRSVWPCRELP